LNRSKREPKVRRGIKPDFRIKRLGISYDKIATDDWDSFLAAIAEDNHETGKKHTVGIERNNAG
jgi:IS1 family transposase